MYICTKYNIQNKRKIITKMKPNLSINPFDNVQHVVLLRQMVLRAIESLSHYLGFLVQQQHVVCHP